MTLQESIDTLMSDGKERSVGEICDALNAGTPEYEPSPFGFSKVWQYVYGSTLYGRTHEKKSNVTRYWLKDVAK